MDDKHIISIEVEDKPGVMSRISSLFSRRNFNVESLTVGRTHQNGISRFTIVVEGANTTVEQIKKQCQKLVHVLTTAELTHADTIMREFLILKLQQDQNNQQKIKTIVEEEQLKILHHQSDQIIIEIAGSEDQINTILSKFHAFKILELIRTGKIGMLK